MKLITDWYKERFTHRRRWTESRHHAHLIKKLNEEVGELAEQLTMKGKLKNTAHEIADIYIVLDCIANTLDVDIKEAVKEKMVIIKRRGKNRKR